MCTARARGSERCWLPLYSKTAFKLTLDEPIFEHSILCLDFPEKPDVLVMQKISRPSDCEVHVTPWGQQRASAYAYLVTSLSMSSNMSYSKCLEPKLYPYRHIYGRNKARKLSSQVVIAASFLLLVSNLHKCDKSYTVYSGKNVTYFTSEKHSGNKNTLNLLHCPGTHSRQDILTKGPSLKNVG
jgi:hypothetical protein